MTGRRTVIRGGLVLDAEGRASLRDVLIEDGRILAIDHPGFGASDDARVLSAADRLLIPGLISAHTHSHGALNRGAVDDKVSLEMFLTGAGASTRSRGLDDKYLSAALSAAEEALLAAKAALGKDQAMFDYARMTAPFDGVITQIYAYTGALLPAGTSSNKGDSALCRLSQNSLLRLVIPVPERAVSNIQIGQSVAVNVSGMNRTFDGKIIRFSDQIDTNTRTMHTEVDVSNPKYELVPGMYASVKIPLHASAKVLTVPVQAFQAGDEGKGTVLVVGPGNKIERRDVVVGLQSATDVEIISGLQENDTVIFGSLGQYRPGQIVAPKLVEPSRMEGEK